MKIVRFLVLLSKKMNIHTAVLFVLVCFLVVPTFAADRYDILKYQSSSQNSCTQRRVHENHFA
jgi:hypothetical protein